MRTAENSTQVFEDAPGQTINIVQAQIIKGFVGVYPLGLHCFHGCEYGAVDEGHIYVSVVRIRTHTQTEHIYDIYYKAKKSLISLIDSTGFFLRTDPVNPAWF